VGRRWEKTVQDTLDERMYWWASMTILCVSTLNVSQEAKLHNTLAFGVVQNKIHDFCFSRNKFLLIRNSEFHI
jgi:hypothetical protein